MLARFPAGTFARIAAVLEDNEDRTDFVRLAVERELERRPRARAPPTSPHPAAPERVRRVEREAPIIDDGRFSLALRRAAARRKEHPPALVPDLRPATRFPTRWTPPVERAR